MCTEKGNSAHRQGRSATRSRKWMSTPISSRKKHRRHGEVRAGCRVNPRRLRPPVAFSCLLPTAYSKVVLPPPLIVMRPLGVPQDEDWRKFQPRTRCGEGIGYCVSHFSCCPISQNQWHGILCFLNPLNHIHHRQASPSHSRVITALSLGRSISPLLCH